MTTLKGKWAFNKELTLISTTSSMHVSTDRSKGFNYKHGEHQGYCDFIRIGGTSGAIIVLAGEVAFDTLVVYRNGAWIDDDLRVVDFGDEGLTATDAFYTWFTVNAFPVIATIKGVWKFNEVLTLIRERTPEGAVQYDHPVNFTWVRSGTTYTATSIMQYDQYRDTGELRKSSLLFDGVGTAARYDFLANAWKYPETEFDRTVDFGEEEQWVEAILYTWLVNNARPLNDTVNTTEITYNDATTTIEAGQTATLVCNGKKALTDVVVVFGADGSITYNGTETAVSAGQTATMACAGKKMLTDVVISV